MSFHFLFSFSGNFWLIFHTIWTNPKGYNLSKCCIAMLACASKAFAHKFKCCILTVEFSASIELNVRNETHSQTHTHRWLEYMSNCERVDDFMTESMFIELHWTRWQTNKIIARDYLMAQAASEHTQGILWCLPSFVSIPFSLRLSNSASAELNALTLAHTHFTFIPFPA